MKTNNTTNTNTSKNLIDVILEHNIQADTPVKFEGRQIFKSSTTGKIYICNPDTKRAFVYDADGKNCKAISLECFRTQLKAVLARVQRDVEADRRIREKVQKFEAEKRTDHNAVLLDAEREDSKFDYRQGEDVLSRTEADSYEETDSLLDDDKTDFRGYHKATLVSWVNCKGWVETVKDGSQRFHKAYILLNFSIDGEIVPSRAYSKQFESFKIQMNQKHHGIFRFMKDSVALDEVVGTQVDVWVKWNELLGHWELNGQWLQRRDAGAEWVQGEWQADFYDAEAYKARKAREAQVGVGSIKGSYTRPTEKKATR